MKRIVFATGNQDKMREIREILADLGVEIVSMKEAGIHAQIEENGTSFEENALIKANAVMKLCGEVVMADDSGLEIDYLDGAPGIYSARFMGEETPYEVKNRAILEKLSGAPREQRTARFTCAIACVFPDGTTLQTKESMEGIIGERIAGTGGFGYDPIFYLPQLGCSNAELTAEQKNALSHRGKALRAMRALLEARENGTDAGGCR